MDFVGLIWLLVVSWLFVYLLQVFVGSIFDLFYDL